MVHEPEIICRITKSADTAAELKKIILEVQQIGLSIDDFFHSKLFNLKYGYSFVLPDFFLVELVEDLKSYLQKTSVHYTQSELVVGSIFSKGTNKFIVNFEGESGEF